MQNVFKIFLIVFWVALMVLAVSIPTLASDANTAMPTYTASPSATRPRVVTPTSVRSITATITPTLAPQSKGGLVCEELRVVSGMDGRAPATVKFETKTSGGEVRGYRYTFGDGEIREGESSIEYRYEVGGVMKAMVEVKDESGNWIGSDNCRAEVRLTNSVASSEKIACSGVQVVSGQDGVAPSIVVMQVTTVDTNRRVDRYRLDMGDGKGVVEQESDAFSYTFSNPGTYVVKGAVRERGGFWYDGGKDGCVAEVRVLTKPLEKQPETGVGVGVLGGIVGMGMTGVGLNMVRRRVLG